MTEYHDIAGPAGAIEIMVDRASGDRNAWAVLCHPHPLYGGSMHDGVLDTAASVLMFRGVHVARFNFRGVGRSEGIHSGGAGEADDLAAVMAWLQATHSPEVTVLGGYSFGSSVAWRVAGKLKDLDRLLLIAPPVGMMPFDAPAPSCPVHAVYGDADSFVDEEALRGLTGVETHCVEDADHFFMGQYEALAAAVDEALGAEA